MIAKLTRMLAAVVLGVLAWPIVGNAADVISAKDAQAMARRGEAILVDIRTPQEWSETGVGTEAHAITMHQAPALFWGQLERVTGGDKSKPVALVCRTGNRSSGMQAELRKAGYTRVLNVGEGMAGSQHGAGWLKLGLGTRPGQSAASQPPVVDPSVSKK